jgi:predicted RNA binding protein YcfA (HicA-like mRNA interferase family)
LQSERVRHATRRGNKEERRQGHNHKMRRTDNESRITISIHPDVQVTKIPGTQESIIQGYNPSMGEEVNKPKSGA